MHARTRPCIFFIFCLFCFCAFFIIYFSVCLCLIWFDFGGGGGIICCCFCYFHQDIGFIWFAFKGYFMQRCTFVQKRGLCSVDSICRLQMMVLLISVQHKLFVCCWFGGLGVSVFFFLSFFFFFCFKLESLRVQKHWKWLGGGGGGGESETTMAAGQVKQDQNTQKVKKGHWF